MNANGHKSWARPWPQPDGNDWPTEHGRLLREKISINIETTPEMRESADVLEQVLSRLGMVHARWLIEDRFGDAADRVAITLREAGPLYPGSEVYLVCLSAIYGEADYRPFVQQETAGQS